jgi:hypothetical protein
MPFEARAAEPFDPRKLASYDASRPAHAWHVDITKDTRFKPDPIAPNEAAVEVHSPLFGGARRIRIPFEASVASAHTRRQEPSGPKALYAPVPEPTPESALWGAFALPIGLSGLGAIAGAVLHPGERWKYAKKGALLGGMSGIMIDTNATCVPRNGAEVTPAPAPSAIEQMINSEGQSVTFINRYGVSFDGSLTGADCAPLTGSPYSKLEVFYDLQKGANTPEKSWQLCTANLNLKGGGALPDAAGEVGVLVDTAANVSYVLLGENQPGAANPYGSLATLKDGKLDLTQAPRYEVITASDGSQKVQITGKLADGSEGPYTLTVRVPVTVEKPEELPPFVMGLVLPLLQQPITPDFATQTPPPPATETVPPVTPTEVEPKEGDTKKVIENEKEVTYVYKEIKSADNKEVLYTGWFRSLTPVALPLWDWDTYVRDDSGGWKFGKDVGPIQIFIEEGASGTNPINSLEHTQTPEGTVNNGDYMGRLFALMTKRITGSYPDGLSNDQLDQFYLDLQDGKPDTAAITFSASGKEYTWSPGPNEGSVIYILNWDAATPAGGNGFGEWVDNTNTDRFRSAFWGTDASGNIIGAIASQKPLNELTDKQIRAMVLFHTISILDGQDMTIRGYSAVLNDYADTSGQDTPPYIQIHKKK